MEGGEEGEAVGNVVVEEAYDPVGEEGGAEGAGLVVAEEEEADELVAVLGSAVSVLDGEGDGGSLEEAQAFGPGVRDGLPSR